MAVQNQNRQKKRPIAAEAFYKSIPVMGGYLILGAGFGILLRSSGYGVLWAAAMSVLIYAGSMQFVGVSLLTGGASVLSALIMTIIVNARHLFYGISMIDRYKKSGRYKPYLIFALTDETYSLLSDGEVPDENSADQYRFLVSLFNQCYWVTGSIIGNLIGNALPFSTRGIEFSMTALFIASFTEQWREKKNRPSAAAGIICSVICLPVFGPDRFLIPAMLLITGVLTLMRVFLNAESRRPDLYRGDNNNA